MKKNIDQSDQFFLLFVFVTSIIYYIGIPYVPFHPDESTQIFMSADIDEFLNQPAQLFWDENKEDDAKQTYRLLDAPFCRILIGIGRNLLSVPPLDNDWDWSKDWISNQNIGALPDATLLSLSRMSVAVLFPASLWLIYAIGKRSSGTTAGWIAAILLLGNPQIALHTRRAMAESALLFTTLLSLHFLIKTPKRLWLLAIPIGLAFNAKQTSIGLLFCGLIIILYQLRKTTMRKRMLTILLYFSLFLFITLLLNPVYWSDPVNAIESAFQARSNLLAAQIDIFGQLNPNLVLDTVWKKILSFFTQVFFTTPQFAETGNYTLNLTVSITKYYSNIGNRILSMVGVQVFTVIFSVAGLIGILLRAPQKSQELEILLPLLITFSTIVISLIFFIPLSFQRYYLPVIPFLCLFSADVIQTFVNGLKNRTAKQ